MYKCVKCNFKTIEENKYCPLCNSKTEKIEENNQNIQYADPDKISSSTKDVSFSYYCYKCKKYSQKKVCIDCNIIGYLSINYKQKHYILNRINKLSDVFSDNEVDEILNSTNDDEKNYIYHNLDEPSRFFYRNDKSKSYTSYFFAIMFYILGFIVSTNNHDNEMIIPYFANVLSNFSLPILLFIGIWYSKNAYQLEESKSAVKIALIGLVISFVYIVISLILSLNYIDSFIFGLGLMFLNIVINYVYYKNARNK